MSITNKQSLILIKIFGWFFILVLISTYYHRHFQYGEYTFEVLARFVIISLPLIAMATCFWHQKLTHQKIENTFGTVFFTKKWDYSDFDFIELYVASSGGSEPGTTSTQSLSIAMKVKGRKAPIGIFTKGSWDSADEIVNEVKNISRVTGVSSINTSERFNYIFRGRFHKELNLT